MIELGGRLFSREEFGVYCIAEIGQNHQGDLEMAKEMIWEAKLSGADCVKFQKSNICAKFTRRALASPYLSVNSFGATYGEHKFRLEFSMDQYRLLQNYAHEVGIDFAASAMDMKSLQELIEIGPAFIKIGSGDANNMQLIETAAKSGFPVVISTGMQNFQTIQQFHGILSSNKGDNFSILHCVSGYPTKTEDVNMNQLLELKSSYPDTLIGYSGHELGFEPTLAAVLFGARIVERHFTLDKNLKGSDHKCSLTPAELKAMIKRIKVIEQNKLAASSWEEVYEMAKDYDLIPKQNLPSLKLNLPLMMGSKEKRKIYNCEMQCYVKLGKTLVFSKDLKVGKVLLATDFDVKVSKPHGEKPETIANFIGKVLKTNVSLDDPALLCYI